MDAPARTSFALKKFLRISVLVFVAGIVGVVIFVFALELTENRAASIAERESNRVEKIIKPMMGTHVQADEVSRKIGFELKDGAFGPDYNYDGTSELVSESFSAFHYVRVQALISGGILKDYSVTDWWTPKNGFTPP